MREVKHNILIARLGTKVAQTLAKEEFDRRFDVGSIENPLICSLLGKTGSLCDEILEKCDEAEVCIKMIEEQENEPTEA